jgi:Myb/SANT-like DNA-binding domain
MRFPYELNQTSILQPTIEMARHARVRRAPNREPTSMAAAATTISTSIEAIDTDLPVADELISRPSSPDLTLPPALPPSEYPLFNGELEETYIYPKPSPSREVTWSPTPTVLPPPPPPLLPPISSTGDALQNIPLQPFRWTLEMEELLFNTLIEQVNIGKRADSGFKKEAWVACCEAVTTVTTQLVTIDKCKGKVDTMKGLWRDFTWLKDQSGFGYDEATGLVQAGDVAWNDIIKVVPLLL